MAVSKTVCADCLEIMKSYPDNYFDLLVADPPCPFCGSKAKLYVAETGVCVMCTNVYCGIQTPWFMDYLKYGLNYWREEKNKTAVDDAVDVWNMRFNNGNKEER